MKQFFHKQKKAELGYVVLYAVLIATVVLAMTVGIANISLKELNFTATSKESHFALFAADTGGECALYHDRNLASFADPEAVETMSCAGNAITATKVDLVTGVRYIFDALSLDRGCAVITVDKGVQIGATATEIGTRIESKGYNVACAGITTTTNPRRVERVLEYTYLDSGAGGETTGIGTGGTVILGTGIGSTTAGTIFGSGSGTGSGAELGGPTTTTGTTGSTGASDGVKTTGTTTSADGTGTSDKVVQE